MIRRAYWIATLIFLGLVAAKFDGQTGFTRLIRFGETWQAKRLHSIQSLPVAIASKSNGYDGQFYAQIALDPLLRDPELGQVLDAPAYRAHRILTPGIAAILGFGSPWWTLQAYALLNVACWLALGWLLWGWTGEHDWQAFARWFGCMFSMGVLESVRQSLVDLPALLLLSLAIHSAGKSLGAKRSITWLALGNLAKETTFLGALALHVPALLKRESRWRSLGVLIVCAVPLGIWWLYVDRRFRGLPAAESLNNFTWPLLGMVEQSKICFHALLQGDFDGRYSFGLLAIVGLFVQSFILWRNRDFDSAWWRIGAAYSILLLFLSLWVWSGYWAACRAVLPLTISFNLLLPTGRSFWPLWVVGNLTLLHAIWRFL